MLDVLGMDQVEERAYRRLVTLPSESASELAVELGLELGPVAAAFATLEEKGLVARSVAAPGHFVASPPAVALGSLIVQRQEDLRLAQLELSALAEAYRGGASERTLTDVIDVVRGPQAVAQRFAQLQRGAKREVLALVKSSVALVSAEENVDEEIAIRRGVKYRVVLERSAFDKPGFYDLVTESVLAGEDVRVRESVPLRLVVADRQLALLPMFPTGDDLGGGALLVHPSGLLDALLALYDLVWEQANPIVPAGSGVTEVGLESIDELDRHVLALLQHGLTDQAIGGQLNLSLRTVQRRVHQLMERAGVGTRFQLGHAATLRGWLRG
jgi:sugar-specific transcriptional regulator TrmB/DNA-binding CsgD family transcriptional regulator